MPAYNSFYPATYQPYQNPYVPAYQPLQQQQIVPQTQPLQTMQSGIIWVSGDKEAAMYPIAPNNAVTLWSQSEPVVYLKQADASGKPTMKIYDLVERTDPSGPEAKAEEYATKADLTAVAGMISTIRSDIDTMKGDLYGVAGKRKASRKDEDDGE